MGTEQEKKQALEKICKKLNKVRLSDWKRDEHKYHVTVDQFTFYLDGFVDEYGSATEVSLAVIDRDGRRVLGYPDVPRLYTKFERLVRREREELEKEEKRQTKRSRDKLYESLDK